MNPIELIDSVPLTDSRKTASGKTMEGGETDDAKASFFTKMTETRADGSTSEKEDPNRETLPSEPNLSAGVERLDLWSGMSEESDVSTPPDETRSASITSKTGGDIEGTQQSDRVVSPADLTDDPADMLVEGLVEPDLTDAARTLQEDPKPSDPRSGTGLSGRALDDIVQRPVQAKAGEGPVSNGGTADPSSVLSHYKEDTSGRIARDRQDVTGEAKAVASLSEPAKILLNSSSKDKPQVLVTNGDKPNGPSLVGPKAAPVEEIYSADELGAVKQRSDRPNGAHVDTVQTVSPNPAPIRPGLASLEQSPGLMTDVPVEDIEIARQLELSAPRDRILNQPALPSTLQFSANGARQVMGQITAGLAQLADGTVEIRLNPAELGRITIHLVDAVGGAQSAIVLAEKPEVLDLLRRNENLLGDEFEQAGLGGMSFSFDQQANSEEDVVEAHENTHPTSATHLEVEPTALVQAGSRTDLDIRL